MMSSSLSISIFSSFTYKAGLKKVKGKNYTTKEKITEKKLRKKKCLLIS